MSPHIFLKSFASLSKTDSIVDDSLPVYAVAASFLPLQVPPPPPL